MGVDDPGRLGHVFAERVNAGDLEGMLALYEDVATFVGPDGVSASGSDAIRGRLEDLLAMKPQITPGASRVVTAGDVALMFSSWRMTLRVDGGETTELDGASTEVARRQRDGCWLYVIDHPALASTG